MAKIIQELKADTVLKNYWNDNDRFADLFNAVLFEGKQVIKPDELEEMDTEESTILENRDFAESIQASRDNIKVQKKSSVYGVQFVLLGLENQGASSLCNAYESYGNSSDRSAHSAVQTV